MCGIMCERTLFQGVLQEGAN